MKKFRKIITFLLIILMIFGIYTIGSWIITGNPPQFLSNLFPAKSRTVLILGMDNEGLRSDVMMVAFMNSNTGNIDLVSIPRDTMVKIGGKTYKINSAYAVGKLEQSKETVENLLGIEIDSYVKFSFDTFSNVIDILGGVDYNVPQDMYYNDPYQDLHINLKAGYQHLNGDQAQQLVRFRHYPMGDEDRIKVQQDFIKELIKQKLKPSVIAKIPTLVGEIGKTVETDVPQSEWLGVANIALKMNKDSLSTYQMPGTAQTISGLSYYVQDKTESKKLIEELLQKQSEK